jgi:hypothetical protein
MTYQESLEHISDLASDDSTTFSEAGMSLEDNLRGLPQESVYHHLARAGAIPESVGQNSTKEKLYAKYCDVIFAEGMSHLGFEAEALDARGDEGDVDAVGDNYKVVGDAKAFRLSRTATNQKDFKVEALNEWAGSAEYSCLLCPLYRYPNTRSQIYSQSIRYGVTLLSYTHLAFMVDNSSGLTTDDWETVWKECSTLNSGKDAPEYWQSIDQTIVGVTGKQESDWSDTVNERMKILSDQARRQIGYWEERRRDVKSFSRDRLEEIAIEEIGINSKIDKIKDNVEMS